MRIPFRSLAAVALVTSLSSAGCVVQHDSAPPRDGTLVVDWSIDNSKEPARCNQSSASSIDVTVNDVNGDVIGTFEQDCTAFAESIELAPGDYTASAVLVDATGKARTTAVSIARFSIYGNDELDIPIDFPAASFF